MKRALRARALDMLTQPHLARQVPFHIYHTPAIARHAKDIFGMRPRAYRLLRDSGTTPRQIAAAGHRTLAQAGAALRDILVRRGDQGVRSGAMSRRQAKTLLAEQDAGLDVNLGTHYRTPAQQVAFVCRPH